MAADSGVFNWDNGITEVQHGQPLFVSKPVYESGWAKNSTTKGDAKMLANVIVGFATLLMAACAVVKVV